MRKLSQQLPRASTLIACLALFFAIGGPSWAAKKLKLKPNSVKTVHIQDGAVTTPKLAGSAVNGTKIAANAVDASKIAANAVDGSKIAASAVDAGKIANGSVGKSKFAASGLGSNVGAMAIASGACDRQSFDAPGVRPGDVAVFNAANVTGTLSLAAVDGTISSNDTIVLEVCNHGGGIANVAAGALAIGYVAFR
jgi:hypothetical protein